MSCISSSGQKGRVPNFTNSEKEHLIHLIANKYASTLEDKKTDRVSSEQKNKAWQAIEDEFNASSSMGTYRHASSLKKLYDNRKKNLRKALANERKETMLTGGGPPPKIKKDDSDDILISILNTKTLVGTNSPFDDDADTSFIEIVNQTEETVMEYDNEDQIHASTTTDNTSGSHLRNVDCGAPEGNTSKGIVIAASNNWKTYTPTLLQTPINAALKKSDKPRSDSENKTPQKASSRRRPTTIIKPLTSSDIAKKYDLLLDKRLELVDVQLGHIKVENELIIKKRSMEIELLQIELNSKKSQCYIIIHDLWSRMRYFKLL